MHLPGLPGTGRALGAGAALRRLAGTCRIPPRLPSFRGEVAGKVSGGRQGRGNQCDPWARGCRRALPRQRFGLCGARALLGVTGTCLINFNGPRVPGMISRKLLPFGERRPGSGAGLLQNLHGIPGCVGTRRGERVFARAEKQTAPEAPCSTRSLCAAQPAWPWPI